MRSLHCSNVPKACFSHMQMGCQDIVGSTVGFENAHGTCVGRIKQGRSPSRASPPMTCQGASAPTQRRRVHGGSPETFLGGAGVVPIPDLQRAAARCARADLSTTSRWHTRVARTLGEAMDNYLGWDIHLHNA